MNKKPGQTLVDYIKDNLDEEINSISENGCEDGVTGMTTPFDCIELYEEFEDEIWEKLTKFAEHTDMSPLLILDKEKKGISDADSFKTKALWFAVELICHDIVFDNIVDEIEDE